MAKLAQQLIYCSNSIKHICCYVQYKEVPTLRLLPIDVVVIGTVLRLCSIAHNGRG